MDSIRSALGSIGDLAASASGDQWPVLALVFGAVLLAILGIAATMQSQSTVRQRLAGGDRAAAGQRKRPSLRPEDALTPTARALKGIERHFLPTNEEERSSIRLRMIRAGYPGEAAVAAYFISRVVLAVGLPAAFLFLVPSIDPTMPSRKILMIAAGLCALGLYLPYRITQSRTESRQRLMTEAFPDALDMLVVCVEAGLGMDAAFVRVSQQLAKPHPVLAEQLGLVALELRAGKAREDVLRNLGIRTGVEDINSFATLLIQSEALGTNLAQTLKVQAEEMRTKRMLRAEEKAHQLPVKLTIPLVAFILPAMFAVVLGPGIIGIVRNILPHLGG